MSPEAAVVAEAVVPEAMLLTSAAEVLAVEAAEAAVPVELTPQPVIGIVVVLVELEVAVLLLLDKRVLMLYGIHIVKMH